MWPEDAFSLPARDGYDVGGAQERAMSARVDGYGGIRETYEVNPDGSVTTLRTRIGWPAFETTGQQTAAAPTVPARGFVAKVPGGRAVLFNPYTLAVLKSPYLPSSNSYSVQDFGTTWNVAPADTTHWYDVVLFDGTTIKVNSKAMPSLRITANHGFPAIPYVINRDTADDQYGNAERNSTEKRVFAVGRYSVKSWGGGGIVETLTPTTPRSDNRSMTIGQRIEPSLDKAWFGQMYFTQSSWDHNSGEWAFSAAAVTMLLTSAYLTKVDSVANVDLSPATLINAGTGLGSHSNIYMLPDTQVAMYGNPVLTQSVNYDSELSGYIQFPWAGTISKPLEGRVFGTYTRMTYSGSASATEVQSGRSLSYAAANTKQWDVRFEQTALPPQTITISSLAGDASNYKEELYNGTSTTLYWSGAHTPGSIFPLRGFATRTMAYETGLFNTSVTRNYDDQSCSFSVTFGTVNLVIGTLSVSDQYGQKSVLTPNDHYYDEWLANPYGLIGQSSGMGQFNVTRVWPGSGSNITSYKQVAGSQSPSVKAEITEFANTMLTAMGSQIMVDSEASAGIFSRPSPSEDFYFSTVVTSTDIAASLTWSTVDYILYDDTNGVYITVESSFAGAQSAVGSATATLIINLVVKTRLHENTQTIGMFSYVYSELLPKTVTVEAGKYAVPSPQIRAIFAPLYQEQGSFKGAHYVTMDEESNGATPFHGFNFLLYLRPYSAFSTCNEDNNGDAVFFVPCNLLEMLYAFVFSSEYGVALSGDRYPVTHSANFTTMMSSLFSNPVRVSVRNGTVGGWTDALGSDFASVSTVSLHRA